MAIVTMIKNTSVEGGVETAWSKVKVKNIHSVFVYMSWRIHIPNINTRALNILRVMKLTSGWTQRWVSVWLRDPRMGGKLDFYMSRVMTKLLLPYANNKGTDQPVHSRSLISAFVVHCMDSIIPLVSIYEISSLYLASLAAQAGLCLTWSQTPKTVFLVTRLISYHAEAGTTKMDQQVATCNHRFYRILQSGADSWKFESCFLYLMEKIENILMAFSRILFQVYSGMLVLENNVFKSRKSQKGMCTSYALDTGLE